LIKALEKARGKEKKELDGWLSDKKFNNKKKVKAVTALYDSLIINTITEKKINSYFEAGFKCLKKIDVPDNKLDALRSFTVNLMKRQV
jgi:geranylgeranyl diphosphate synthase type II